MSEDTSSTPNAGSGERIQGPEIVIPVKLDPAEAERQLEEMKRELSEDMGNRAGAPGSEAQPPSPASSIWEPIGHGDESMTDFEKQVVASLADVNRGIDDLKNSIESLAGAINLLAQGV